MADDSPRDAAGFEHLAPAVRWVWFLTGSAIDLAAAAVVVGVLVFVDTRTDATVPGWIYAVIVGLAVVGVPLRAVHAVLAHRAWRFRFTDHGLEMLHGVIWRRSSAMPFHRLQQVDTEQGPLERLVGLSTLRLRSAAATTDAVIPGVAEDRVAGLRLELLERAGRGDGT